MSGLREIADRARVAFAAAEAVGAASPGDWRAAMDRAAVAVEAAPMPSMDELLAELAGMPVPGGVKRAAALEARRRVCEVQAEAQLAREAVRFRQLVRARAGRQDG